MTTAAIPIDYRKRKRLWINASLCLVSNERPTVASSIQNLGYAERILLELEAEIANLASDQSMKRRRDCRLMECSAHSELWILGLYEVLRTLRETRRPDLILFAPCSISLSYCECPSRSMK